MYVPPQPPVRPWQNAVHDSTLKRMFSHPSTIERAVRQAYPGRAAGIDFPTLQPLDSGLVSDYRVISAGIDREDAEETRESAIALRDRLPRTVLRLLRAESNAEVVARVGEVRRQVADGGRDYDEFMAGCIVDMLVSEGWATREQLKGATTMAQVETVYPRRWEEFGRRRFRQGREEGLRQGRARLLRDQAAKRFGEAAAEELSDLLGEDPARHSLVAAAVIECETAGEFLSRVRRYG